MKITTEETINKFKKKHGNFLDYSKVDYKGSRIKVIVICPIHGEFLITPNNHLTGYSCKECGHIKKGLSTRLTLEEFIEKAKIKHGDRYSYLNTSYTGAHNKLLVTCRTHGDFLVTAANHWSNGVGCPHCFKTKISKGEQFILDWLIKNDIKYECQKTFKDLYHLNVRAKLKYDFYLPNYNLLIEYDGEYHYKAITYGNSIAAEEQLAITQLRDKLKTEYADRNNYNLLRIRFDDNVESKLKTILTNPDQRDLV